MDEEQMWKGFYEKLQEIKTNPPTEHESHKMLRKFSAASESSLVMMKRSISSLIQSKGFIGGDWTEADSKKTFDVFNPATGELVGKVPDMGIDETKRAIEAAKKAFHSKEWADLTGKQRSALLKNWHRLLEENRNEIAQIMTAESGKLINESQGEVTYGNSFLEWYSEEARRIYGEITPSPDPSKELMMIKQPIGVAGLITPWNFPHAMITRKAGAALAAGCTIVVKPAEDTPLTALALTKLAEEAGFPKGVFNVITSSRQNAPQVGEFLCKSPDVAGISFTGSTAVGKLLYKYCADGIKRISLELGGNAPFIVFNSAKIDEAVDGAMGAKFRNSGQACVAANRFYIQDKVYDEFLEKLSAKVCNLKIGTEPDAQISTLINQGQFNKVHCLVEDARKKGASVIVGGKARSDLGNFFYEPTIITDIKPDMLIYQDEVFGPVISIVKFSDEEEVLQKANNTCGGLAGYFFSQDLQQVFRVARKLEVGMVGINVGIMSTVEAPFGGVKESGIGREGSRHGIEEYVIQDLDGGFFEKFGSLLRQKSQMEETHMATPLAPLPEEEDVTVDNAVLLEATNEIEHDSGTETLEISQESDSETDDARSHHDSFIEGAVGMNIDELYEEILFEILNNIGCEASEDVCQSALLEYVQEAFRISNDKHDEILKAAEEKEPPEIRLNVEIIKAENLMPKDSNGFSDPFVTLFLESASSHRYNTSVKAATLNPLWEEHFSLPIPENPNNEILVLEVWDFDAAETVGEKMNKLFEVKGIRGLRKLMKEIAVTASTGKHDNELIGRTAIPLKTIPASGIKVWYSLEKGTKSKSRGSVLLRLSFSAEKNNRVAAQEHRHLLKMLLMHELETSKVAPYWWRGKFSGQGEAVLTQHSAQSGLSPIDCALAQWSVFAQVHQEHPLAFALFNSILDKIIPTLQSLPQSDDEIKFFWEGSRRLLPSCFSIIRKLRKKTVGDKHSVKMLSEALDIISKVACLEPPDGFDLLPRQVYGWIIRDDDSPNWDIRGALRDAVNSGAEDWFEYIHEGNDSTSGTDEERLQNLIKIIQLIRSDLQKAIEYYDKQFQHKMHFSYAQTLYVFYEKKLADHIQPVVEDVCKNIKRLNISEERFEKLPEYEEINMGTTLFELYLVLKRFTTLGSALCPGEADMSIYKYHEWFTPGVTHWLDISVYKALTRIEKAIDLDKLMPVDETVKYSSSAVDTLAIFYQIKIFWQQLGWPDAEGAYMFVGKIVDDICRCCVFYADRMSKRVEELYIYDQQGFEVTREWCLAINNIDYIRQSLSPFIKELGVDEIIARLAEYRTEMEAERCAATIKNVLDNAIDTERNKILQLIEVVARKMSPAIRRFLTEGAEVLHEDSNSMDRLMMYLEESLKTLNTELNEINFERILDAIWTELSAVLFELVQSNLDKRRPPAFFSNLRDTLHIMVNSFKLQQSADCCSSDKETLEHIERLLELHAYETADLIHQYYLERLADQSKMSESPYGQLTVRARFEGNVLKVEIMNARNLAPMDSNGSCDSFVKIHFMPADKFLGVSSPKTSVQHKTLFPLYDEKFSISLSPEQRQLSTALLIFSVKDKDLFGMSNQYIAECYLSFSDIDSSDYEQVHLTLSRPEYKETDSLRALEYRQGDKQARDFIKKLKQKSY